MEEYHEAERRHDAYTQAIIRHNGGAVDHDGAPTTEDDEEQ